MHFRALAILLVALVILPNRIAVGAAAADPLAGDSRLDRPITVTRARTHLGALLQEAANQAGVKLSVPNSNGPIDGIELTAVLDRVPLRRFMTGVEELLSTPYNAWDWTPSDGAAKSYTLRCQRSPAAAAAQTRQAVVKRWTDDLRQLFAVIRMPAAQRAGAAATARKELFPGGYINHGLLDLAARTPEGMLQPLLRGADVPIDVTNLTPELREALKLGVQGGMPLPDSVPRKPTRPGLYITWPEGFAGPILWIRGDADEAANLMGGLAWDAGWIGAEGKPWKYRMDPEVEAEFQRGEAGTETITAPTLDECIVKAARKLHANVLMDFVQPDGSESVNLRAADSPERTFYRAAFEANCVVHRSGDLWLLRKVAAMVSPRAHLVPWSVVAGLRRSAARRQGVLSLEDLAPLTALSPAQLAHLSVEFPEASTAAIPAWKSILQFSSVLGASGRRALASDEGLRYADAGLAARAFLEQEIPLPDPKTPQRDPIGRPLLLADPNHARVRLQEVNAVTKDGTPDPRLHWEAWGEREGKAVRSIQRHPRHSSPDERIQKWLRMQPEAAQQ